jgi:hypothetical protein
MCSVCILDRAMNPPPRSFARRRADGPTALALAAGLALGHVVAAMAEQSVAGALTIVAAFVFIAAGSAGTVCALLGLTAGSGVASGRGDVARWIFAIGAGLIGALSPGFF